MDEIGFAKAKASHDAKCIIEVYEKTPLNFGGVFYVEICEIII